MDSYLNARYVQRIYGLLIGYVSIRYFVEDISTTFARMSECLMLGLIVYYYLKSGLYMNSYGKYIRFMLSILVIWSIVIVFRADWGSGKDILFKFIELRGVVLYLLPFLFFLSYDKYSIKGLLDVFFIGVVLTLPLWLLNVDHLVQSGSLSYRTETIGALLPFFAAFLLLFSCYFTRSKNYIIKLVYVVYFVLMFLNARRNASLSFFLYGIIAYYIYIRFVNHRRLELNIIMTFFSVLIILILFINMDSLQHGSFRFMAERAGEDSRSGVEQLFLYDFSRSPITDWIFGRGIDGTYYQEVRSMDTGDVQTGRAVIETGYLDMILKGGVFYVVLILMILLPAIYKGVKSKSIVGVSCGLFLFTYLIDMYTAAPVSTLSVRAILFWFCVSICYRDERYIEIEELKSE